MGLYFALALLLALVIYVPFFKTQNIFFDRDHSPFVTCGLSRYFVLRGKRAMNLAKNASQEGIYDVVKGDTVYTWEYFNDKNNNLKTKR